MESRNDCLNGTGPSEMFLVMLMTFVVQGRGIHATVFTQLQACAVVWIECQDLEDQKGYTICMTRTGGQIRCTCSKVLPEMEKEIHRKFRNWFLKHPQQAIKFSEELPIT